MPPAPPLGLALQPSAKTQINRFTERLQQNHENLLHALSPIGKFQDFLHSAFVKKVIDARTYKTFLTKLENNPQCQPDVVSGQLMLIIYEHIEKNVDRFPAFYECTNVKSANGMEEGNIL